MRFVADALTALRFIMAATVAVAIWHHAWQVAAVAFIVGILSDAFDGTAARKWPYSDDENSRFIWRRHPHELDNAADLSLSTAALLGLAFVLLPWEAAIMTVVVVALISVFFVRKVEGLAQDGKPKKAERVDVVHGFVYGSELIAMLVVLTIQATDAWWPVAITIYAVVALPLLWLKRDRLIGRKEVSYVR